MSITTRPPAMSPPIVANQPPTVSPPIVTSNGPTQQQIDALVQERLNAPDQSGQPNAFQMVDKFNISPQAKKALEDTMAAQMLTVHDAEQGGLSDAQGHFIFNGSVYNAIKSYADGQGSLSAITYALGARAQRIDGVVDQPASGTTPPPPPAPPATPPSSPTGSVDVTA